MTAQPLLMHDLPGRYAQFQHDLFDDFLPFFEHYVIDPEYGGFLCSARPDGERVSDEKRTWYEGRGIWVFAYLFNNICREQKYRGVTALWRVPLTPRFTGIYSSPRGLLNSQRPPAMERFGMRHAS